MSTLGLAADAKSLGFGAFNNAQRTSDGVVVACVPAAVMQAGGLFSGSKQIRHTLVLTAQALYVFKGEVLNVKEITRVPLGKIEALLKSFDQDARFTLAYQDGVSPAFESLRREAFCADLKAAYESCSQKPLAEVTYDDKLIASLIAQSKKTPWATLLQPKVKSRGPSRRPSDDNVSALATAKRGSDLRPAAIRTSIKPPSRKTSAHNVLAASEPASARSGGDTSANNSASLTPATGVGLLATLGPMTLLWRRLEHTLKPHLELQLSESDQESVGLVLGCLTAVCATPEEEAPFGEFAPASALLAARSVASVLTDPLACRALADMMKQEKGAAFLASLDSLIGCGDAQVRRWAAVGLLEALPIFANAGVSPNTPIWLRSMLELATSSPKKENPVMMVLFASKGTDDEPISSGGGVGLLGDLGDSGASDAKISTVSGSTNLGRPAQLRTVGKSTMSIVGHKTGGGLATVASGRSGASVREQSNNTTASAQTGNSGVMEKRQSTLSPSALGTTTEHTEGKLRGAFSLVWLSRLADLENGVLDNSNKDSGGIKNWDVQTIMQLMLGRNPTPLEADPEDDMVPVETFGANIENVELIPSIVAALAMTRDDALRCAGLKQLNVLVLRNVPAIRALLSIPDWQSTLLPILYSVPYFVEDRTPEQSDTLSYALHLTSTLIVATFGARSPVHEFGPLDKIMASTIYKIAVYGGWSEPTIDVTRMLLKGVLTTILKHATTQNTQWRFDPASTEWEELLRMCNLLQTFLFYRPELMCRSQVPAVFVDAMDAGITQRPRERTVKPLAQGEWRTRIVKPPVLCRIQPEKLVQLNRQLYSCMQLPVMSPVHRGEDMGIHLTSDGLCADRSLVEVALALWAAMGVTGVRAKDSAKADEYTNKAEKTRVMYASKVCEELRDVSHLFDNIDAKAALDTSKKKAKTAGEPMASSTMESVTEFFEKQKRAEINVGFMSRRATKSTAVKLRTNMLQQREFAKRIQTAPVASEPTVPKITEAVPAPPSSGRTHGSRGAEQLVRNVNTVLALRGDAITIPAVPKSDEPLTVFEQSGTAAAKYGAGRKTLVKLERGGPGSFTSMGSSTSSQPQHPIFSPSPGESVSGSRKRSHNEACHACDKIIVDETAEVLKFGFSWHAECLNCSQCHKNILTAPTAALASAASRSSQGKIESHQTYTKDEFTLSGTRFYPVPELLLCSKECRMMVLANKSDSRCPGCMDGFDPTETCLFACGRPWHKDIGCFRCTTCEVPFGASRDFFEYEQEPYCKTCYRDTFLNCASQTCKRALGKEPVVQAANGSLFHEGCFKCSVCSTPFGADGVYYSGTGGLLYCLSHFLQRRSPPCSVCRRQVGTNPDDEPVIMSGLTFHKNCFNCAKCARPLSADAAFNADDEPHEVHGQIYCPDCYASEYALKCHKCNKGIRGDVLHAGVGKFGEPINWHPNCFDCDECHCKLLEQPFIIVTLGEDTIVPLCMDHYKTRYLNLTCRGCGSAVKPGKSKNPGVIGAGDAQDEYTAVMFEDGMYHAQCLMCHEEGCTVNLFEEQKQKAKFVVNIVNGVPYCAKHAETHQVKCFACGKGISEQEPCNELMDWVFHDRPECFCCILCKGPFLPDQALRKRLNGPCHAQCPPKEETVFEKELLSADNRRKTSVMNRKTGRKTKTGRAYRRQSSITGDAPVLAPL